MLYTASIESSAEFRQKMPQISDAIQSNILTIANLAVSKHLITQTVCTLITDPAGKHCGSCILHLLNLLESHIKVCPQDLKDKFIPILVEMDDPGNLSKELCKTSLQS